MMQSIKNVRHRISIGGSRILGMGLFVGCAALAGTHAATAADAPKGPQISRSIAKEVSDGQKALQANQFAEGLKHLQAAEAVSGLTAYDHKSIDDLKAFAYVKLNNLKAAQESYEAAIETGAANSEETTRFTKAIFSIAYSSQQYPKAIEYGKKLVDANAANGDTYQIVTQSYYLQKDCKNAVAWADKSISYARKEGETPKENLYLFKLQCAFDASDTPATIAALEDLIRLTGKTDYWNKLLRFELQDEKVDANILMIYRVMYNTQAMNAGSDYMEMAQLLGDAALPGEAQTVLEKALASGLLTTSEQKDRATRLLNATKQRADADRKGLPQLQTEAGKNAAGELDVKLGEVYYGFGDYQNAVTAINAGLQKGSVKHLDEAYVYLGLSEQALKDTADSRKAFASLKTVPNISQRVLKLWTLYAEKEG